MANVIWIIVTFLFFQQLTTHTRGHMLKLFNFFSRTEYFFARKVIEPWNNLPPEVVSTESENDFKRLVDCYSSNFLYNVAF